MRRAAMTVMVFLLLALAAVGAAAEEDAGEPAPAKRGGPNPPTFEQTYAGYAPKFIREYRGKPGGDARKFSRQKDYVNMADVRTDSEVRPTIKKANELVAAGEHRKATTWYRKILKEFPDDLIQIAERGIFIPASLYVQRKNLAYPKKELDYYRVLYDPAARAIYEKAVRRYSLFDYKELADYHLATSYGDDTLFALGNDAVDKGQYKEARRCYERIVTYHGLTDEDRDKIELDRDRVWVRLAICYKHLGQREEYRAAAARIADRTDEAVARLLEQLEKLRYDEFAVHQREGRRSARYDALDDRSLSGPMPYDFSANRGKWTAPLPSRSFLEEPEALPWATETDLIYKDRNVLYSRSLLTGELNWVFGPGGTARPWDRCRRGWDMADFAPNQSILVQDGVVCTNMFVYGPSLVAVDQYTGMLLWAKGPIAAQTEKEGLERYQACPAAGRGMVVAPVVFDDIRGRSHLSSSADLAAFETRTGKLLWRTTLARIAPLKITQSRYPRKIRILSSTPLLKEGVVYHVTNAGVVAAVDACTGRVRWITRYPQSRRVLDNLSHPGVLWSNEAPMIRGGRLYVTPLDCQFLLCLDTETGRILWEATRNSDSRWVERSRRQYSSTCWRMAGITSDDLLCVAGRDLAFLDPKTGRLAWHWRVAAGNGWGRVFDKPRNLPKGLELAIDGEGNDYWCHLGHMNARPTLTLDGKVYFANKTLIPHWPGHPFNSEYCLDLEKRGLTLQRRWFSPQAFVLDHQRIQPLTKRVVNEEPEAFYPASRMTFTRWGIPFEVDITYNKIVTRYDREKLEAVLETEKDLNSFFAKAEIARKKGDVRGAIKLYERCKRLLPSEEEDRRRNINLRLFPLYTELARWAHQAVDISALEHACRHMGATASTPAQEIQALLAYAELHQKKGDHRRAAHVLRNISRHYWREPLEVSGLSVSDRDEALAKARTALDNLLGEVPPLYQDVGRQIAAWEEAALPDYFLTVANVDHSYVVEARTRVAERLQALLSNAPASFRRHYQQAAGDEMKRYRAGTFGERLLWCWPGAEAARKKVRQLAAEAEDLPPVERQARLWRLDDLARACGLGDDLVPRGRRGLRRAEPPTLKADAELEEVRAKNPDPNMVRLALPQRGAPTADTARLLFVGGRKRRAFGNRYNLLCWDMRADRKLWETPGILLHERTAESRRQGESFEVGFEQVFLWKGLAVVHGQYDVIAFDRSPDAELYEQGGRKGQKRPHWHFRVPLGFKIDSVAACGDLLILCGGNGTLALALANGQIVWDAREAGDLYAGPFFHDDTVLTVRYSPSEVSFRRVGNGRLLARLRLPGLTTNVEHPLYAGEGMEKSIAAAEAAEAPPVACAEGELAVTDGRSYHLIDVEKRRLRWSRRATKLDPARDPPYRLWLHDGKLVVLKLCYAVLENVVFDTASGELIWRRREGGKRAAKVREIEKERGETGEAVTGLVLGSMVFRDGVAYGIKYQMASTRVELVGMDLDSGNQVVEIVQKGYESPEAFEEPNWCENCVTVHVKHGNRFEIWRADVTAGKIAQKTTIHGYGRFDNYGEVSAVWQGPYQALWAFENRKFVRPAP